MSHACHPTQWAFAHDKSSGQHTVSVHSKWKLVFAHLPTLRCLCVGVHKRASLMCSSLLLLLCSVRIIYLMRMVCEKGDKWPYDCWFVGAAPWICLKLHAASLHRSNQTFFSNRLVKVFVVQPYSTTDTAWQNSCFIIYMISIENKTDSRSSITLLYWASLQLKKKNDFPSHDQHWLWDIDCDEQEFAWLTHIGSTLWSGTAGEAQDSNV